jgi:hypothetical protein
MIRMRTIRLSSILVLALNLSSGAEAEQDQPRAARPNIVLIMVDEVRRLAAQWQAWAKRANVLPKPGRKPGAGRRTGRRPGPGRHRLNLQSEKEQGISPRRHGEPSAAYGRNQRGTANLR